jgi:hypothetical protein
MHKKIGKAVWLDHGTIQSCESEESAMRLFMSRVSFMNPYSSLYIETGCCKGAIFHGKCDVCLKPVESTNIFEVSEEEFIARSAERLRRRLDESGDF